MSSNMQKMLQQSAVLEALFDNSSVTDGPTWLRTLMLATVLDGQSFSTVDYQKLEGQFKEYFLNASDISILSCNKEAFEKLVILQNVNSSDIVSSFVIFLFFHMGLIY